MSDEAEPRHAASPGELLALALLLAGRAGELLLAARAGSARFAATRASASTKSSSTDLATDADRASEALVRDELARLRPDDAVLGEEAGASGGSSGLVWIIDPLDGTTNYVYDHPAWSVSIAVAERVPGAGVRTLAGVVRDPLRDETFAAATGAGATLNGASLALGPPARLDEALVGTGFAYASQRRRDQARLLTTVLPSVRDIRRGGSAALDLCYVAAGRLDAFYESGLKPWDRAAGVLIASEAGAATRELHLGFDEPPGTPESSADPSVWYMSPGRTGTEDPTLVVSAPGLLVPLLELLRLAAR